MRRSCAILLSLAACVGLAGHAAGDDSQLLAHTTAAPNVLLILDTSQSMTWYTYQGRTRGDEYLGWSGDKTPMARMAMLKSVTSTVVDTFFSRLRLGLASYAENGNPANPNAAVRIKNYWYYYCSNNGTNCGSGRTYSSSIVPYNSNTGSTAPLNLLVDASNLNMPAQSTFTLNWALDRVVMRTEAGTPAVTYCTWDVVDTRYPTGTPTGTPTPRAGYPQSDTDDIGTAPCPAKGTSGTLTETEAFDKRAAGDDPNPYKYNVTRKWTGTTVYGVDCTGTCVDAAAYNSDLGLGWTDRIRVYTYNGKIHAVPATPTKYYWTYYYKGTCVSGCTGYLTDSADTNSQTTTTPVPASPLKVPFTRIYTWSGNNYEMKPPSAEKSCPVGAGITVLVDPGSAPDATAIRNYLGTGPDKTKELHGANYYTPLATGLETARQYFLTADAVQKDAQRDCRQNYVILVTDGGESCALVPLSGTNSPGSKAGALLRAKVPTFVVGLDASTFSANEQLVLADIAAQGGTGTYYSASNAATLQDALNKIISGILHQQTYSFTSPVVPSVRSADNLLLIQAYFSTPDSPPADPNTPWWPGELKAFALANDGTVPNSNDVITASPLFQVSPQLAARAPSTRTIKTYTSTSSGPALVAFDATTPAIQVDMRVTLDVNRDGQVNSADAVAVGQVVIGNNGQIFKLGDIFHSTPVLIGPPNPLYTDRTFDPSGPATDPPLLVPLTAAPDTFAGFRTAQSARPRIILAGANDGMLHAFDGGRFNPVTQKYDNLSTAGSEVWGFIPTQMLPSLQYLAVNQGHRYFVDGSPKAADVWLDDNGDGVKASTEWHTVVIGGFRQGGSGLYALDVTDTQNPSFLWNYATTGESWSEPAIGKVRAQVKGAKVDRWVAVAGDGYAASGTLGNKIHVIDIKTGKALWQFTTAASVAAPPILVDANGDGYADRIYVGTVGGDFLRCDVSAVAQHSNGDVDPATGVLPDNWSCSVLLAAGPAQPFYTGPTATVDETGKLWVFVGSGDRSQPLLIPDIPNRMYGIVDPYPASSTALTEGQMTDVTDANTLDSSLISPYGWFIVLRSAEKAFAATPLVFNKEVTFTTFTPGTVTTACGSDVGAGSIYQVFYKTGGGMTDLALFSGSSPTSSKRIAEVRGGAIFRPVITTGTQGANAVMYLGNSNNLTITPTFNVPSTIRATQYWRIVP